MNSQTHKGSSLATLQWPGLRYRARLVSARRNNMEQPPCGLTTRRDKYQGQGLSRPGGRPGRGSGRADRRQHRQHRHRDVERHLAGGKRARTGAGGGAVPSRYSWAHLHAQHWLWNQAPGEGLDFVLLWSCPGGEAPCGSWDPHKPPAERVWVGVFPGE